MIRPVKTSTDPLVQDWSEGISIVIPTFRRPEGIQIALESVLHQDSAGRLIEVVVADNDPAGGARNYVERVAKTAPLPVIYTHIPKAGVSNARNGALDVARGRFIVFLDDDMEATEGWLKSLLRVSEVHQAGLVFGAVIASMPKPDDPFNAYMEPFFSRVLDKPEGLVNKYLGTGGSMLDLTLCQIPNPPFDTSKNEIGGEDDFLFAHLVETGTKVAWSPHSIAHEHVPASRATPKYLWTRNFAFGQGPTQSAADRGLRGIPAIVKWMIIGAIQTVLYSPAYLTLKFMDKPSHMKYLAKVAQGLGKILWWEGFTPRLYGVATLQPAVKKNT